MGYGQFIEEFLPNFKFPQIQMFNAHWQKVKLLGLDLNAM